jgi:perosamine synthetase
MTFVATSNAVIMAGATPVFCEVQEDTFCIDPEQIKKLINNKTKAIMPVHLYGQSADMDPILRIAKEHSLAVIEDAAQGVGVKYKNKHVGPLGDCGILSFYGNKTITCGEGGVIVTNNEKIKQECYRLKNHGRDVKGIFKHEHIGYNFSFTEMQAAIGIAQMNKLNKIIAKKAEIQKRYHKELLCLKDVFRPAYISPDSSPVFWFTSYSTDRKEELQNFLQEKGIQTRNFFYPLHMQPCYSNMHSDLCWIPFPVSEKIYKNGISLPSSYNLTIENQYRIIEAVKEFYGR